MVANGKRSHRTLWQCEMSLLNSSVGLRNGAAAQGGRAGVMPPSARCHLHGAVPPALSMGLIAGPGPSWFPSALCPGFVCSLSFSAHSQAGPEPGSEGWSRAAIPIYCPIDCLGSGRVFPFEDLFLFFLFFNLPPPTFSSHFQPASGGQNRRGCSKTFLA